MNHKKFIQLLNLYIDGEASPTEAREVELEIQNDPSRRRVYHDYCRIQGATRAIFAQFRNQSEVLQSTTMRSDRLQGARVGVLAAHPGRTAGYPFRRALFWAGGAAAACMAITVAFWSMPHGGALQAPLETADTAPVSAPAADATAVAATAVPGASNVAPFAAPTRADPYVQPIVSQGSDPFVLSPTPRGPSLDSPKLALTPVAHPGNPDKDALASAAWPLDTDRIANENRKLQEILRGSIDAQNKQQDTGPFVPVNLRR